MNTELVTRSHRTLLRPGLALAAIVVLVSSAAAWAQAPPATLNVRSYWPKIPSTWFVDLKVVGGYAYGCGIWGDFFVLDVSQPAKPQPIGWCDMLYAETTTYARGVDVVGNLAYVADSRGGLVILDISDPARPMRVGRYGFDANCGSAKVRVDGRYAYMVMNDDLKGLQVIDVGDPTKPRLAGFYWASDRPFSPAKVGNHVYLAMGALGLAVVDVTDPATPVYAGGCDTDGDAMDLCIVGNVAYVADGPAGLAIIDITNPTDPVWLGQYATTGYAWAVHVEGTHAYLTEDLPTDQGMANNGLTVIDVSDPTAPTAVGGYITGGTHWERVIEPANGYLYLDNHWAYPNLQVIDIRDPANPSLAGGLRTSYRVRASCLTGDYAYVVLSFVTHTQGWGPSILQVLDLNDRLNPRMIAELPLTELPDMLEGCDIQVRNGYLYVAEGIRNQDDIFLFDSRLAVIDVSTPSRPTILAVNSFSDAPFAYELQIADNYAYVVVGTSSRPDNGLHILDIRDPANPIRVGFCQLPYPSADVGQLNGLCVVDCYAYLADYHIGLHVIDVLDPSKPVRAGDLRVPGGFQDVSAGAGYLYAAYDVSPSAGLAILDITAPARPIVVGHVVKGQPLTEVQVQGPYALCMWDQSTMSGALHLLDVTQPLQPFLVTTQTLRSDGVTDIKLAGRVAAVSMLQGGVAFVEISPVLRLDPPVLSADTLTLSWNGGPGIKLQKTASLRNPNWQDVPGSDGVSQIELLRDATAAFFRVIQP